MISPEDQERLVEVVQRDWELEVKTPRFLAICAGKERGHRIADFAEERTLDFIEAEHFDVAYEHGVAGGRRARSMGDVWLRSGDPPLFNPINVKAGIAGVGGQPNMVSLAKLTEAILAHRIDSYWLLLLRLEEAEQEFTPTLTLVNIFDYLEYMHFDSGPGQIMLRSDAFYNHVHGEGGPEPLSLRQVVEALLELRRDGDRRLIANRARKLEQLEDAATRFDPGRHVDQATLDLRKAEP